MSDNAVPQLPPQPGTIPSISHLSDDVLDITLSYLDIWDKRCLSEANRHLHMKLADVVHICGDSIRSFAQQPDAALVQLVAAGAIRGDTAGVTRFLFDAHQLLPAKAVGKYIAAPADPNRHVAAARAYELTTNFLQCFEFSDDTPVQCLRKLLARTRMPPGTQSSSAMFKRVATRYVECQRAACQAPLQRTDVPCIVNRVNTDAAGSHPDGSSVDSSPSDLALTALAQASSTRSATPRGSSMVEFDGLHGEDMDRVYLPAPACTAKVVTEPHRRHVLYGFDVATLDEETTFLILYSCLILNCDMRSSAIKQKMTREDFISRNISIPNLALIPPSFFAGTYDELALQGLPVADAVPTSPVRHAVTRNPAPQSVALLEMMVSARMPTVAAAPTTFRQSAGSALSWMRRAAGAIAAKIVDPPTAPSR